MKVRGRRQDGTIGLVNVTVSLSEETEYFCRNYVTKEEGTRCRLDENGKLQPLRTRVRNTRYLIRQRCMREGLRNIDQELYEGDEIVVSRTPMVLSDLWVPGAPERSREEWVHDGVVPEQRFTVEALPLPVVHRDFQELANSERLDNALAEEAGRRVAENVEREMMRRMNMPLGVVESESARESRLTGIIPERAANQSYRYSSSEEMLNAYQEEKQREALRDAIERIRPDDG